MSFWNHMFDGDRQPREDIDALRQGASKDGEHVRAMRQQLDHLQRHCDRLQLVCNALVEVIEKRGVATREELEVLVQRLDLLDGVEDGRQSSEVKLDAPRCAHCNHFVNPRRRTCVYCGQPIPSGDAAPGHRETAGGQVAAVAEAAPPRTIDCGGCGRKVAQHAALFTSAGLRCERCFSEG